MNNFSWLFCQLKKGGSEQFPSQKMTSVCVHAHVCVFLEKVSQEGKAWSSGRIPPTPLSEFLRLCGQLHRVTVSPCLISSLGAMFGKAYWSWKHLYRPTNKTALQAFPTCILSANISWTLEWKVNILCYLKAEIPGLLVALKWAFLALALHKVTRLQPVRFSKSSWFLLLGFEPAIPKSWLRKKRKGNKPDSNHNTIILRSNLKSFWHKKKWCLKLRISSSQGRKKKTHFL